MIKINKLRLRNLDNQIICISEEYLEQHDFNCITACQLVVLKSDTYKLIKLIN